MTIQNGHLIWEEVYEKIIELDSKIFACIDKTLLSDYEKRKMIFEYLCNNLEYDFDAFIDLVLGSKKFSINFDEITYMNPTKQYRIVTEIFKTDHKLFNNYFLFKVIDRIKIGKYKKGFSGGESIRRIFEKGKGMCNSDSIVYKLLLEYNNIYSAIYICDNKMIRPHVLNLVYDRENDSYSFDDISTYTADCVEKNVTPDMYFDYDCKYANEVMNQGFIPSKPEEASLYKINNIPMKDGFAFYKYDPEYISFLIDRKINEWHRQFILEIDSNVELPSNIVSLKNNTKRL